MATDWLDDVRIQTDSVALRFVWALCQRDHHDLLAKKSREIEWCLQACEAWGHEMSGRDGEELEPYGEMVYHIVVYDRVHGHTPDLTQLQAYMWSVTHDPKVWGHNNAANQEYSNVIAAWNQWILKDEEQRHPGGAQAGDAETMFSRFFDHCQWVRMKGMFRRATDLALGAAKVYDAQTRHERRSTYNDALNVVNNFLRFNFVPEGTGKSINVPDIPPEEALYGWLGDEARKTGMPLGFIYPALLGVFASNKIRVTNNAVHPCLYVALAADVETGKSQAIDYAEKICDARDMEAGGSICHRSASSDRGIYTLFGDDPKQNNDRDFKSKRGNTYTMCLTELRHLFTKMGMNSSALPATLCALWDNGKDNGTADKFKNVGCQINLSIVGGLKCEDTQDFADVFGQETMHGLMSRFIIAVDSHKWVYEPFNLPVELRIPVEIEIPAERWEELRAWRSAAPQRGRAAEIALRIAVISEAAEHGLPPDTDPTSVGEQEKMVQAIEGVGAIEVVKHKPWKVALSREAFQAAMKFMEWQEQVKAAYQPSKAVDEDAKATEAILNALEEHGPFKWSTVARNKHWTKRWGAPRMHRCRAGLVANGLITYDDGSGWVQAT